MGGADYINVLYSECLNFDPDDGEWVNRDRFFLDPGHMSPMLYATLSLIGKYSMEDLKNFRQWGSITPGHPEVDVKRGVENTSGPLGQGHAMAVGAAIAERFLVARFGEWMAHKTYAFISDGGIQEEISQGAGRIAGTLGLANLIMFYDSNNIQLSTKVDEVTHEDTAKKYEAWGWQVITIDGKRVDANAMRAVSSYFLIYVLLTVASILLVSLDNFDASTTITAVFATVNNIGPGLGMVGPVGNFAMFSPLSKIVLTLDMLFGRLELYPMLVLLYPGTWKRR